MITALTIALALLGASDARVKDAEGFAAHGEPDTARAAYTALLDELTTSGASSSAELHYNIGTLALGAGDVGGAVLHLLAAERRAPLNEDVRHNLAAALSRRADQVEGGTSLPLGARLPPGPVRAACGLALALAGIVLALAGLRRNGLPRPLVVGSLAFAAAGVGVFVVRAAAERAVVVVVQQETQARPQPDATAAGFTVHPGLTGAVVSEQQGFSRLRLENGVDVWVDNSALAVVP